MTSELHNIGVDFCQTLQDLILLDNATESDGEEGNVQGAEVPDIKFRALREKINFPVREHQVLIRYLL